MLGVTIRTNAAHTRILNTIIALISVLERDFSAIEMNRLTHAREFFWNASSDVHVQPQL